MPRHQKCCLQEHGPASSTANFPLKECGMDAGLKHGEEKEI